MIYQIYKITNKINNKPYIGFTENFENRKKTHIRESRKEGNTKVFHKALLKYGEGNFIWEVIYCSKDYDHCCDIMEEYFIRLLNSHYLDGYGYNMTYGGNLGIRGYKHTDETKKFISDHNTGYKQTEEFGKAVSERVSGEKNPFYGKNHTEESKKKCSISVKKAFDKIKEETPEIWEDLCKTRKENAKKQWVDQKAKGWVSPRKGKPSSLTEEQRKQMSESRKGKSNGPMKEDAKKKLSQTKKDCTTITNGITTKQIKKSEYSNYDNNIWKRGRTMKDGKVIYFN